MRLHSLLHPLGADPKGIVLSLLLNDLPRGTNARSMAQRRKRCRRGLLWSSLSISGYGNNSQTPGTYIVLG
jgi:hypothetical protein